MKLIQYVSGLSALILMVIFLSLPLLPVWANMLFMLAIIPSGATFLLLTQIERGEINAR